MDAQAIVWFVIAAVASGAALRLFYNHVIARKPSQLHSRGGATLFAICLFLFAIGALVAGFMTAG